MFNKDDLQLLYRYAYSLTCDEHNGYDLLQAALEKFIKLDVEVNHPVAYMKKIIYNRFIDDCRHQKLIPLERFEESDFPADFDVQTLEELLVNENMVEKILQCLEPDEREILYCWAIEGFSTSEIAIKLEKPKGTVLSKIYRMREKIGKQFSKDSGMTVETEL